MKQFGPCESYLKNIYTTDYGRCIISGKTRTRFCGDGYIQKCSIEIIVERSCAELVQTLQDTIDACKDAAKGYIVVFEHVSGSTVLPNEESRWHKYDPRATASLMLTHQVPVGEEHKFLLGPGTILQIMDGIIDRLMPPSDSHISDIVCQKVRGHSP
ncbi:MAG: hypothetical protein G01um101466_6 [Parcubacteria group bacterium Gr01-1014_66]|nr:MAG: hypothetical protein G01um101466_6 [Parcubacteria group bacterium Gr01-1014_66]